MDDLQWSLNPHVLPNINDDQTGSPSSTINNDQITHHMFDPDTKQQSSCSGGDKTPCKPQHCSKLPINITSIHRSL